MTVENCLECEGRRWVMCALQGLGHDLVCAVAVPPQNIIRVALQEDAPQHITPPAWCPKRQTVKA